jgi:hypothetical protein
MATNIELLSATKSKAKRQRKEYIQQWRDQNREKLRQQGRDRYAKNPDKFREEALRRYHANPELHREISRRWKSRNKDKVALYVRRKALLRLYGITPEEYGRMLKEQKHRCQICKVKDVDARYGLLDVDHCHETGKVRALLCNRCNRLVAQIEVSGREIFNRTLEYIDQHAG